MDEPRVGRLAAEALTARGLGRGRIAVEPSFLTLDAHQELAGADLVDGSGLLDELRAVKRPDELEQIRTAADAIIDSMAAVFAAARPGVTQQALADHMHIEEARRGLDFEYCLVNTWGAASTVPRPPRWRGPRVSCAAWTRAAASAAMSATWRGWASWATCRRGRASCSSRSTRCSRPHARRSRPDSRAAGIFTAAEAARAQCPDGARLDFVAHGMGLISHEVPRLTSTGPVAYAAEHAYCPLEAGMVLSVETDLRDPDVGFVKLEDAIVVTEDGYEALGDRLRDWNLAGA